MALRLIASLLLVSVGCGGTAVTGNDAAGADGSAGGSDGGNGGAPPASSSDTTASTGGLGGACQDGFIELMGEGGPLVEAVCYHGKDETTRPVGFFYFVGPEANGTFVIGGCGGEGSGVHFWLEALYKEPGTALAGKATYQEDGTTWLNVVDAVSITIGPIGKVGTTVEGSYSAQMSNGLESLELFGTFRVCRVSDTGII